MALIIQKFGGTSVGDIERIQKVAEIVTKTKAAGHDVIAVVSAMSGETDRLIDLAHATVADPNEREFDSLVATGEQVSAALLSMMLIANRCPARSLTGFQVKIFTDDKHRKARITNINTAVLKKELHAGRVPVVTGFQGINDEGHITTFGRGGSDITAVALASTLRAQECQIYTDVDGVYTSDPRVVKEARRLDQITFEEMLELASLGAKVLQLRAVEFAHRYSVPLRVLSSFEEGPGTLITVGQGCVEKPLVSGIAFDRDQAKITIRNIPAGAELVGPLLAMLNDARIDVDMIIQNVPSANNDVDFSFTVHLDDFQQALRLCKERVEASVACEVIGDSQIAKLSLVGVGMKSHASVASKMLKTLGEEGIKIHLVTSSEIKISVVIDEKYMELGARVLHSAFALHTEVSEKQPSISST